MFFDYYLASLDGILVLLYLSAVDLVAGDSYLLIACDGLWDVYEDQEAIDLMVLAILGPF